MAKISQKEIVVRFLASRIGTWVPGWYLQKLQTQWGLLGVDADTRAHELVREGSYESPNFTYKIESRKVGKFVQFRVSQRTPKPRPHTFNEKENNALLKSFDEYPTHAQT